MGAVKKEKLAERARSHRQGPEGDRGNAEMTGNMDDWQLLLR